MVFVTDALLRKSVVVCQSLGRRGIDVTAGSTTRLSPAFFSRHCRRRVIYPCPRSAPDQFVEMMLDYLRRNRHAMLFPTDDVTVLLVSRYRDLFERVTHVPIPSPEQIVYGLDKARTMRLAASLQIPHPRTVYPESAEAAAGLSALLPGAAVIKPRASSGGRGIAYVAQEDDIAAAWSAIHRQYPYPLVQERIAAGPKYDVCVLMDRAGAPVASFVQKELRHFPVGDGMSTVQESVWRPDLVERTVTLLKAIGWYGLAEVEFMENPATGETVFLEINPRVWASIKLAIACGIDFPYLLYQVASGQRAEEIHTYPVGRRCRWLLPGDLLHFVTNPDRLTMDPPFFHFGGGTVYDGFNVGDPAATLGVLLSCGHYLRDGDLWGMLRRGRIGRRGAVALHGEESRLALPAADRQTA